MSNNFIKLNMKEYRDRVQACWVGKNIGGTIGGPYEGARKTLDVTGFQTEPGKPLPNDDLDLQLIWLHAVETLGPLAINANAIGEFWATLLPPNWNEYGIGKNNMRRGLVPPISGDYENSWKNSNGAWIRTEVWACLAPGCPALAAKYAMEDAKVDHGAGEGTVAAAFVAAMQSAAFAIRDLRTCIELGLAAIPETSRMADSIRFVLNCYDQKMSAMDARNAIFERNADIGDGWFEAPSNVSYAIIGLLWGNGDFKKSMLTAINCGDDTDCTAGTVGATLGILGGTAAIPADWGKHIGDDINTVSINRGAIGTGSKVPKTCTELTERVIKQAPFMLLANQAIASLIDGADEIPEDVKELLLKQCNELRKNAKLIPYSAHYESAMLLADIVVEGGPDIEPLMEKTVSLSVSARPALGDQQDNLTCRWWLPDGFTVTSGKQAIVLPRWTWHNEPVVDFKFTLKAGETVAPYNRCVLEIVPEGRCSPLYIPILYLG